MNSQVELITQIPAFNQDYFSVGEAVRIRDNVKKTSWDGLVIIREKDRIGIVKVQYVQPINGSSKYEAVTNYFYIQDIVQNNIEIVKL